EAGQRAVAAGDVHLGLGGVGPVADDREDPFSDLEAGADLGRHPCTPTRMPRSRAGTAGCPVWPICWGWPLPQFGVPQKTHSSRPPSMSIEPQNRGLMPVYVGVRSTRVRLPPLIPQPISQPNWKFRRLSSIDHERFVSM